MIDKFLDAVKELAKDIQNIDERKAYACGYDSATNGPNIHNCNFLLFSNPGLTKAWERGAEEAKLQVN